MYHSINGKQARSFLVNFESGFSVCESLHSFLKEKRIATAYMPIFIGVLNDLVIRTTSDNEYFPSEALEFQYSNLLICSGCGFVVLDNDSYTCEIHVSATLPTNKTISGLLTTATIGESFHANIIEFVTTEKVLIKEVMTGLKIPSFEFFKLISWSVISSH